MANILNKLSKLYHKIVFGHPVIALSCVLLFVIALGYHMPKFHLSASSDALVLENDKDLEYYRELKKRYGSDEYLVITYSPNSNKVFDKSTISDLNKLHDKLENIPWISSVISILNVPLIRSPQVSISDLINKKINTLNNPDIDMELAEIELVSSPLYSDLLVSRDAAHTALLISLPEDEIYNNLIQKRNILLNKPSLDLDEKTELKLLSSEIKKRNNLLLEKRNKEIQQIRGMMSEHMDQASLYLGGVPMIVVDSISFIDSDIRTFGLGVLCFIILLLLIAFRSIYFMAIAVLICSMVSIVMVGFLGLLEWPVTIVSSNFIALLLIITLSIIIHLIVCYRELRESNKYLDHKNIVRMTINKMFTPCFYTAITTIIAFTSLIISGIKPVIDFGWMMTIGISTSFIMSFIVFPILLTFLEPNHSFDSGNLTAKVTGTLANLVKKQRVLIMAVFAIVTIAGIIGVTNLTVENRFIDYYKKSTEIYQGMELIDKNFGGTTPLDVVIDAPQSYISEQEEELDNIFAVADDSSDTEGDDINNSYWFNSFILDHIIEIHNYLDSLPQTGKILSLGTTVKLLQQITNSNAIDSFTLNMAYNNTSDQIKNTLFKPYISDDGNQIRFSIRVFESSHLLKRDELIKEINHHLTNELNIAEEQIHINGMMVLYNNILQSLFKSQILTLGVVFLMIWIMFIILFRNLRIAVLTIIPNIISAIMVLGVMGIFNIPLDIMTITIAAICVGIAVDDAIHYVHRYMSEYKKDRNYEETVTRSHLTIGKALYYTTVTITFGFSILVFSNFIPTIYFGLLTGLSMIFALLANITLLPVLLKYAHKAK